MQTPEPLSYEPQHKRPRRQMPYWTCLLFIPAGWVCFVALALTADDSTPDDVRGVIAVGLAVGTYFGFLAGSLALFVMFFIDFVRWLRFIWKTGAP